MYNLLTGSSKDWRVVLPCTGERSSLRKLPSLFTLILASILPHLLLQLGFGTQEVWFFDYLCFNDFFGVDLEVLLIGCGELRLRPDIQLRA